MAATDPISSLTTGFGVITYDGVSFNALRQYTYRCEPVYDEADWTVTHLRCLLRVHGWIMSQDVSTQESTMDSLQTTLTRPGRRLQVSGIGLDLAIDTAYTPGATRADIIWGAKPRLLSFQPAGGMIAWEFDWEVEFNVYRDASPTALVNGHLVAFNWIADYAIDDEGLTTRTITGYFEVPGKRANASGSRSVLGPGLEDRWSAANIALPTGFRRVAVSRRLSADRRRMDFTVVDKELTGDPYPQGIVHAELRHEFSNEPPGFIRWHSTLSGSFTVAKGYPKALAGQKFFLILADVAAKARAVAHASNIGGTVVPVRLRIATDKFGRTTEFFVAFVMAACLEDILAKSGLWTPVIGTNYSQWRTSMENAGVMTLRGVAGLVHTPAQDKIVDLGASQAVISIGQDGVVTRDRSQDYRNKPLCPRPTERNSYLEFTNRIQAVEQTNSIVHRAAQVASPMNPTPTGNWSLDVPLAVATGAMSSSEQPHVIQYSASTDQMFLMYGQSLRLLRQPAIPELTKIGNVEVEKLAQNIDVGPVAAFFDCPLYYARWTKLYRVKGYAPTMAAPSNKFLCIRESSTASKEKEK